MLDLKPVGLQTVLMFETGEIQYSLLILFPGGGVSPLSITEEYANQIMQDVLRDREAPAATRVVNTNPTPIHAQDSLPIPVIAPEQAPAENVDEDGINAY